MVRGIIGWLTLLFILVSCCHVQETANTEANPPPAVDAGAEEEEGIPLEEVQIPLREESAPEVTQETVPELVTEPAPAVVKMLTHEEIWADPTPDESLEHRFLRGIFRSRMMPKKPNGTRSIYWERCGEPVSKEDLMANAAEWADTMVREFKHTEEVTGVRLPYWGAFATIANESGFNECSLNLSARKWAVKVGLVDKFQQSYPKETVWKIIKSKAWRKRTEVKKGDFGPWQMRFPTRKLNKRRFNDLLSMEPGILMGAKEMARRARMSQRRYKLSRPLSRPWMTWPGWNIHAPRNKRYDEKITSVARWLGAKKEEIARGYL